MVFGLLPSCGGGEAQPTATNGGGPGPVTQGEVYNWRYQSNTLAGAPTWWIEEEYVANLATATGGRLNLELQPQGAIVGSMEIFDAVATGAIEVGAS
jgi:TRAP-type mannitol/chloroaromatic compound transport system substrate-binding protein